MKNLEDDDSASELNHDAYVKGDKLFKLGRYGDAAAFFRTAMKYWPEDPEAHWALAGCYSEMGKHRKAEAAYRRALEFCNAKDRPSLLYNIGNELFDRGRFEDAEALYAQVPRGDKIAVKAKRNLALARVRRLGTKPPAPAETTRLRRVRRG